MQITYIHHSCFLVETDSCYYLFDYEKGILPAMDVTKPMVVLSSHGHHDHYNPAVFAMLGKLGMQKVSAVLSEDIVAPADVDVLQVSPGREYTLAAGQKLIALKSTDLGVAFLIEEGEELFYHAGDLNDWVWEGESEAYNEQMTFAYRTQIDWLASVLKSRTLDVAFVVLDPRQEQHYDRGLCYFLERIPVGKVYPMHYWEKPTVIGAFLKEHPKYKEQIQETE